MIFKYVQLAVAHPRIVSYTPLAFVLPRRKGILLGCLWSSLSPSLSLPLCLSLHAVFEKMLELDNREYPLTS